MSGAYSTANYNHSWSQTFRSKPSAPLEPITATTSPSISTVEPKVMTPYNAVGDKTPRKIEIARRKRLYAQQDIEVLLRQAGVDDNEDESSSSVHQLPLESFDDTEYDQRTAREWAEMARTSGVSARGVWRDKNGKSIWRAGVVVDYQDTWDKYEIVWEGYDTEDGEQQREWLSRIHVMFLAEDPFNFAARVTAAHKRRKRAVSVMVCVLLLPVDLLVTAPKHVRGLHAY